MRIVQWPAERSELTALAESGVPRLLIVAAGAEPPVGPDCCQDRTWKDAGEDELRLRMHRLALRALEHGRRRPRDDLIRAAWPTGITRENTLAQRLSKIRARLSWLDSRSSSCPATLRALQVPAKVGIRRGSPVALLGGIRQPPTLIGGQRLPHGSASSS